MAQSLFDRIAPRLFGSLSDRQYASLDFLWHMHRIPNIENPNTFNEKIQWIRLNYRPAFMTRCTDKLAVRDYVRTTISDEILVPLLCVYENVEDIDFGSVPEEFIIKTTHGSGWNIICRSRSSFDRSAATAALSKWLHTNYYDLGREWAYKDIQPHILCEPLLLDEEGKIPIDYKLFCFHGEVRVIEVDYDRFVSHKTNFFDTEWNQLPIGCGYPNKNGIDNTPPTMLKDLIAVARRLSSPFPFVRVDMYALGRKVYFGELTFYPRRGRMPIFPRVYDRIFGSYLDLRLIEGYE